MPNANKRAKEYDEQLCRTQVQYLGLVENMRVRRAGYAYRMTYERFIKRYGVQVLHCKVMKSCGYTGTRS